MKVFSARAYRGVLDEIARRVDSLTVVTADMPTLWSASADARHEDGLYELFTISPRLGATWATIVLPRLRAIVRDSKPDIVHVVAEPWQFLTLQALHAARSSGAIAGIQFAENGPRLIGLGGSIRRVVGASAFRRCSYAVGMTAQSASVARRLGGPIDIEILPPPMGISRTERVPGDAADVEGWFGEGSERRLRISFVGRLAPDKGLDDLMRTCDALEPEVSISVAVAGDGPLRSMVAKWAARRGHHLHGHLDRQAVLGLLSASDLLMVPSRTVPGKAEQFGRVTVEAMSRGTPVVAYDCGGLREVIGDAGLIVPEGDIGALESAIRTIAGLSEEGRRVLRERARLRANQFTDDVLAEGLIALWRRVCSEGR